MNLILLFLYIFQHFSILLDQLGTILLVALLVFCIFTWYAICILLTSMPDSSTQLSRWQNVVNTPIFDVSVLSGYTLARLIFAISAFGQINYGALLEMR